MNESGTPRTDAIAKTLVDLWDTGVTNTAVVVPADFARQLERELAAAQGRIKECEKALQAMADDGWLYYGPEGMSEAQELLLAALAQGK